MGNKYAIVASGTGYLTGGFIDDSVIPQPFPAGAVGPITDAQWSAWITNPTGFYWTGSTVATRAPASLPPATGLSTRLAGATIHSTGTPAINDTYPVDPQTMADLTRVLFYVATYGSFPGGMTAYSIANLAGTTTHVFGTTTLFTNFVKALIGFVALCQQYDLGASGVSLPGATTTIA